MISDGDTSRSSAATASALVRSAHRTSVEGIRSAALRLAGTSRSVATTCRPSTISCRTVSEPTSPNAPVTSTVSAVIVAAPSHRFALHRRRRAWRNTLHADAEPVLTYLAAPLRPIAALLENQLPAAPGLPVYGSR